MTQGLHIALLQATLVWESPEANRERFGQRIAELPPEVDLAVLPEMFTTGFSMEPWKIDLSQGPKTLDWMKELAQQRDMALVGSLIFGEGGRYFNRLFFVHPDGRVDAYDKRHCFTLAGEDRAYQAGNHKLIVTYRGLRFCPLICYDLRFPVWSRNVEDYDALIYVANWPAPRIGAWDSLLQARAIENMAYCIGVNRVGTDGLGHRYPGHSAVYDMLGNQMCFSLEEGTLYAVLDPKVLRESREKLRFLGDRDRFSLSE